MPSSYSRQHYFVSMQHNYSLCKQTAVEQNFLKYLYNLKLKFFVVVQAYD